MLALAPQILFGLGEEGGEPIFATSSRLKDLSASPRLHVQHTRISNRSTSHLQRIWRSFAALRRLRMTEQGVRISSQPLSRVDGEGPVSSCAAPEETGPSPSTRLRMTVVLIPRNTRFAPRGW